MESIYDFAYLDRITLYVIFVVVSVYIILQTTVFFWPNCTTIIKFCYCFQNRLNQFESVQRNIKKIKTYLNKKDDLIYAYTESGFFDKTGHELEL